MGGDTYEKGERIGEGAYGIVHKACNRTTGEVVALKRIRLDSAEEGVPCSVFREISLLMELKHPNIVRLHEVLHSDTAIVMVLEFCDTDVRKYLDSRMNDIEADEVRSLLRQLLLSIEFCHMRSVLHRDLKPQNLLLTSELELKLADFGLARSFGLPVKKYTHEVVTLWYRPPDILLGSSNYGTACDIWSIGCIFAEMATGEAAFQGRSETDQLLRIFKFLGTPTMEVWPSMVTYPNARVQFNKPELSDVEYTPEKGSVLNDTAMKKLGPHGFDLLCKMLCYEPETRITATAALQHPYFSCTSE